jgi:hypothetical protein
MSMHGRNDRSIHTDALKISRNLARHHELMTRFENEGMSRTAASKLAMDVVRGLLSESAALARVQS